METSPLDFKYHSHKEDIGTVKMDHVRLNVGVAGLRSMLLSCVQMFEILDSGKEHGTDYLIPATAVGMEQVRLSLWGQRIGFIDSNLNDSTSGSQQQIDRRLQDHRIFEAVFDILSCIKRLLEDRNVLQKRYGLEPSPAIETRAWKDDNPSASQSTFKQTYKNFQITTAHPKHSSSLRATSKWIITDMERFKHFIKELRGFNDSLFVFFPDVGISAREEMIADINVSVNADDLYNVGEAVADGDGELFYAITMRLREISQSLVQQQSQPQREVKNAAQTSSSVPPANLDHLANQINNLGINVDPKIGGALDVLIQHSWGTKYSCSVSWKHVTGSDHFTLEDKERDFVKPAYLAWALQHATERMNNPKAYFGDQNAEANSKYEGKHPGTVTAYGYVGEFCEWAELNRPEAPDLVLSATNELSTHTLGELVNRLHILQTQKSLPWGREAVARDLRELIGTAGLSNTDPIGEHDITSQILRILEQLNRQDIFDDLRYGGSISTLMLAPSQAGFMGMRNFLLQIILGYQLLLRLRRAEFDFSGLTKRVAATLQIAERWMDGISCVPPEGKPNSIDFHSLVHERQVEGLIRFAEALEWPHLSEMRKYAQGVYANGRSGGEFEPSVWDWIFGAMFPGDNFVFKIMSALVMTTPPLQSQGESPFFSASLVLPDRSYWRSRYVVGRVLAGIKGVKSTCGWVGPCPAVADHSISGWVRIRSRKPAFLLPSQSLRDRYTRETTENSFSAALHDIPVDSQGAWIKDTSDPSKWVIQNGPSNRIANSTSKSPEYTFHALYLSAVAPGPSGSPSDTCPEYAATIEIIISNSVPSSNEPDNSSIVFSLLSQPTFIAAHRCFNGPHSVHESDLPRLQNIYSVSDLIARDYGPLKKRQEKQNGDVLIIDARCEGGELVARAWCAEIGQHAVVRRGEGACFACAVRMASGEGLGVGCLIWS